MCNKIGNMIMLCNHGDLPMTNKNVALVVEGLIQLQYDLELLRKCTLDNPNFKLDKNTSNGYTESKVNAFRND